MFRLAAFIVLLVTTLMCQAQNNPMNFPELSVTIGVDETTASDELPILFNLTNTSSRAIRILKWGTPLENGFNSNMFEVWRGEARMPYTGKIIKRGTPSAGDFLTLAAGESITKKLDIADGYEAYQADDYRITFKSVVTLAEYTDNRLKTDQSDKNNAEFRKLELRSESITTYRSLDRQVITPKQPPAFSACSLSERTTLEDALSEAEIIAGESLDILNATPEKQRSNATRYTTWFGRYTSGRYNSIREHFNKIHDVMANRQVTFDCTCDVDNPSSTFAYVFRNKPYRIHLCGRFWTASLTGQDSKAGTIIHETSHFSSVSNTHDHVYGQSEARNLAQNEPEQAINNADNHEYFAENTPALSMDNGATQPPEDETQPPEDETQLILNQAVSGRVERRQWLYYRVSGASRIILSDMSADIDLYVRRNQRPTFTGYDCNPFYSGTRTETCDVSSNDTVFIAVNAVFKEGTFTLLAEGKSVQVQPTTDTSLNINQAISGNIKRGQWQYYQVTGASRIILSNMSADFDLYVRKNQRPTRIDHNCRPFHLGTRTETCDVSSTDILFIAVRSFFSDGTFTLLAEGQSSNAENTELVYVPLGTPCRIVNTHGAGLPFNPAHRQQSFFAWGNPDSLNPQRDKTGENNLGACLPLNGVMPSAMAANVTVAAKGSRANGSVVAYPFGSNPPTASLVNFQANNIANSSIITLAPGTHKHFTLQASVNGFNTGGSRQANVIIDALGYFYPREALATTDNSGLSYIPLPQPCRIVNTSGVNKPFHHSDRNKQSFLAWGTSLALNGQRDADGSHHLGHCLPESNMIPAAMMANFTVAAQGLKGIGNTVAFQHGVIPPTTSLVNFTANNIANASIVALKTDGTPHFDIEARIHRNMPGGSKRTHMVVDVQGYFYSQDELTATGKTGLRYIPLAQTCRIVDTRGIKKPFHFQTRKTQAFRAWGTPAQLDLQRGFTGLGACQPKTGLTPAAIMANITVAAKRYQSRGNVVSYPTGSAIPKSSLVNFLGNNIANSSILAINPNNDQHFNITADIHGAVPGQSKQADVIVDVIGYFY